MRVPLRLAVLLLAFCCVQSSFSQSTVAPTVAAPGDGRVAEWMYGEHITAVPSLPFSAKVELEFVNQLQDGTLISHKTYNLDARDSGGRTHNEARKWINPSDGADPSLIRIELYDPSTKTRTTVFPPTKTARQWAVSTPVPTVTPFAPPAAVKPDTSKENIGSDTIEGLPVRGTRVSQTYAPGALGNDRPLTIVTEYWFSQDLRINLLTKRTDPRYGVQTVRVTELRREEPDSALFAIPEDYKLVKEIVQSPLLQSSSASEGASTLKGTESSASSTAGIARAGVGGVTQPHCTYCPDPSFSEEARAAHIQGVVVLKVVVSADGQAENVQAVKGPGYGLENQAVETVKKWRFKPAVGPSGTPVACVVMVAVSFKLG
jgi:TonB family protein